MSPANHDLHGSAPDKSSVALILIDVINDLDFPEAEQMLPSATAMAKQISELKSRAKRQKIPVIYVNDNFGRWRSDFSAQVKHCLREESRGRPVVELLQPEEDDYFVLKPKHSGFFSTTLDTLLDYLEVKTTILTGMATNICVLFTANDAYMRDFQLVVPRDCVAANTSEDTDYALLEMQRVLKADIRPAAEVSFDDLKKQSTSRQTSSHS